jgi:uncharacterized protein YjbJ (UPF0337 family)
MSARDKLKNATEKAGGKVKEVTGRAKAEPGTERRGRRQQVKADLKGAGEQVKDAGGKTKRAFKH